MTEFTQERIKILDNLDALKRSYRALENFMEHNDSARSDRFMAESWELAGYRVCDYRKKHSITLAEERAFAKAVSHD